MIDSRYLNDVTSSMRSPSINIVVLGAILLLTTISSALVDGPYNDLSSATSPSSMPQNRIPRQIPLCHTRSNAFLKSMKL